MRWEWGRPGLGPRGQGQGPGRGGDGYLAGEGFRERLPVRAERAGRVVISFRILSIPIICSC